MASVVPAILADTAEEYGRRLDRVKDFARRLHIDICDGVFTGSKTIGLSQVYDIDGVPLDIHLMTQHPESQIENIVSLQPSLVICHFEAESDRESFFRDLRESDIKVGLAINPETKVEQVQHLLPNLDHALVFTGGHLGYYGGQFQTECLDKIAQIKAINPDIEVSVDGGVDDRTAKLSVDAGADVLDCGSFLQNADDPHNAYESLQMLAGGGF